MTNLIERFVDFATDKVVADVDNTNTDTANLGNNGSDVAVDDNLDLQSSNEITNASAVSTDDASIANVPASDDDALRWQEGIETGKVETSGVDNSNGNDNWGQSGNTTASATFDNAFKNDPDIVTQVSTSGNGQIPSRDLAIDVANISTTGFDMQFRLMSADDYSGNTFEGRYLATEGR